MLHFMFTIKFEFLFFYRPRLVMARTKNKKKKSVRSPNTVLECPICKSTFLQNKGFIDHAARMCFQNQLKDDTEEALRVGKKVLETKKKLHSGELTKQQTAKMI